VQGRLRNENLVVEIDTACAHCGREIHLTVDSELQWSVQEPGAPGTGVHPLLFMPEVDWQHFAEPNIIDAY
jgi:hypothetical protein